MLLHAPWGGRALIEGALVLDIFAGTGALGLEALSFGAARAIFVERDRAAQAAIARNIASLQAAAQCELVARDLFDWRPNCQAQLLFLDPPYGADLLIRAVAHLLQARALAAGAVLVLEAAAEEGGGKLSASQDSVKAGLANLPLVKLAERAHGAGVLRFFRNEVSD